MEREVAKQVGINGRNAREDLLEIWRRFANALEPACPSPMASAFQGQGQNRAAEQATEHGHPSLQPASAVTTFDQHAAVTTHHLFFSDASLHTCRNVFFW
jgi:hypothetical protein